MNRSDEGILRNSLKQVIKADLTREHGWREGTEYHLGPPKYSPDKSAGESLVKRGILARDSNNRLRLSEAALARALRVAIDAAVADLIANEPPKEHLPTCPDYYENGPGYMFIDSFGNLSVREWL